MVGLLGALMPNEDVMQPAALVPQGLLHAFGPSVLSRMRQADQAQQSRLASGDRSPTPLTEENMWLADDVAGGLLGPLGMAGIFAGVGAKTANRGALEAAERMAKEGADPRAIWRETGWFQGPDGQWRWEIDDSGAALNYSADKWGFNRDGEYPQTVGEFMQHSALFDAYPEDASIAFSQKAPHATGKGERGSFAPAQGAAPPRLSLSTIDHDQARSTTLHELQHSVQESERFAEGGSPMEFIDARTAKMTRDALAWKREVDQKLATMPGADRIAAENALVEDYRQLGAMDWLPDDSARHIANQPWFWEPEQVAKAEQTIRDYGLDRRVTPYGPDEAYRRLAGEAEARAVQARRDMTPTQRRDAFPLDSYDVPINELIVRTR